MKLEEILYEWNNTTIEYPKEKCVHQLFELQVAKTPDACAVSFEQQSWTYTQLNRQANQLAHYLRQLGVKPEILVGVCLERSLQMVVTLLAILKAGGAYVPLDIKFPQTRLAYILEDAQIHLLLTQEWLINKLPKNQAEVIYLDQLTETISVESQENLSPQATPEHLMYILFTSGSTGKPKGVEILHRSVVNLLTSMAQQPGLTDKDVVLSVTTLSFDISVLEIYLPLIVGAEIVIASSEAAADGRKLLQLLESYSLTVMQATPATWQLLLNAGWSGNKELKILCGGETLSKTLANKLLERTKEVWNLYGPTETTVWSTAYLLKDEAKSAIIGRAIANTKIYILDENLQPLPVGSPGELFIGGDGLARGYLGKPDLTAEKFITDPFSKTPLSRMYRTGDLAKFLPDGNIVYLGRIDHQVKIRGFRVELTEIEIVITEYPTVKEAVVVAVEYDSGDQRLVAYIVPHEGEAPTNQQLYNYTKNKLPEYMLPSFFVLLDALPLTPNNKIDRRALPKPEKQNLHLDQKYLAPGNDIEQNLVSIWEKVLGIHPIGITDNFFSLGGNSLLATSLVAKIQKLFNKTLSPTIFFEAPTIKQLSYILNEESLISSSVVRINISGKKPPLFIIGDTFLYQKLINYLEVEQPIYIIEEPLSDVVEMATHCIEVIRNIQTHSPYHLLGHSFNGLVAYEIAQQLYAQGQKVEFLGLVDTPNPILEIRVNNASYLHRFIKRLNIFSQLCWQDKLSFLKEKILYRFSKAFKPLLPLICQLIDEYMLEIYPGKLTIFAATFELHMFTDANLGWSDFTPNEIEVYQIPSSHLSILLEPTKAQIVAKHLTNCVKGNS